MNAEQLCLSSLYNRAGPEKPLFYQEKTQDLYRNENGSRVLRNLLMEASASGFAEEF